MVIEKELFNNKKTLSLSKNDKGSRVGREKNKYKEW